MKGFLLQTLVMLLGSLVPIWLRAVLKAGEDFSPDRFVAENRWRIALCFAGVLVLSPILSLDAIGLEQILQLAGMPAQIASSAVIGFAVSSFVMAKGKSKRR